MWKFIKQSSGLWKPGNLSDPVIPPVSSSTKYGSTISMDCLGNRVVGAPAQEQVSQRFKATETSTMAAMTWLCVGPQHEGYGAGTGGTIRMTLRTDSNGMPSSTVLATYDFVPGNPSPDFLTRSFASPPSLTAGQVYHLVHTNIDPDPIANYVSVDATWNWNPATPMQPRWSDSDWAQCRKLGANAWELDTNCTPILQITYGNGVKYGNDYAQVNPEDYGVIAGTSNMVRQRFTISGGDKTVTGVTARVARTSGTGNLVMTLLNSSGVAIDSCSVTNTLPVSGSPTSGFTAAGQWLSGTFSSPQVLTSGQTYYLRLSTDSSTSLWVRPIMQMGLGYGLDPQIGFGDGYCEKTVNGSTWTQFSSYSTTGDLQFYFAIQEAQPVATIYGPGIGMDSLGNIQIGPSNVEMSYRFRATQSSTIPNFRVYWLNQDYVDYGAGTGGTIRCTIQTDNAGVPSGTILATLDVVHPASDFPLKTFASPPSVTAGTLYHLVFTNIDAAPNANFVSIDSVFMWNSITPRQPAFSDTDYAVLEKEGSWSVSSQYTPIMDLTYGNTAHQGIGYMENEDAAIVISGTSYMGRERIIVSGGNQVVTGAGIRMAKTSGTGNLVVRLEDSSNTLIDSFTIPASAISVFDKSNPRAQTGTWVSGSFSTAHTLVNGATYYLRFSTDASTEFWTRGIQRGTSYGFSSATYFTDGLAQKTTNGSTWAVISGLDTEGDLQCYFTKEG